MWGMTGNWMISIRDRDANGPNFVSLDAPRFAAGNMSLAGSHPASIHHHPHYNGYEVPKERRLNTRKLGLNFNKLNIKQYANCMGLCEIAVNVSGRAASTWIHFNSLASPNRTVVAAARVLSGKFHSTRRPPQCQTQRLCYPASSCGPPKRMSRCQSQSHPQPGNSFNSS